MPDAPPFLRLFVALPVPEAIRREIARARDQLRREVPPGIIRWTQPEQYHLTLKFLGDVPAGQVEALQQTVQAVAAPVPPLTLTAHGLGCFPSLHSPRVLWAGAQETTGQLATLARQLAEATQPFAPTEKPETFTAHITLGRFKPGRFPLHPEKFRDRFQRLADKPFGGWTADAIEIVRSELTAAGAQHEVFARCPLCG
jgi:RNA 2',3'-cyclic 3'-phosphodiesterase